MTRLSTWVLGIPLLGLLIVMAGCGQKAETTFSEVGMDVAKEDGAPMAPVPRQPANAPPAEGENPPEENVIERKIQFTASLRIIVEDFEKAESGLLRLVKETEENKQKSFVSYSEIQTSSGQPRSGTYTIRVPVGKFTSFREAVLKLGEAETNTLSSQDRTLEYYDLQAHIENYKTEEVNLKKLLEKKQDDYKIWSEIRKDLREVRLEIDRLEGRLKVLKDLTSLTTITVTLIAREKYEPASFGTVVGRTFSGSVNALGTAGRWSVLVVVALVPWIPLIAIGALLFWWAAKRQKAQTRGKFAAVSEGDSSNQSATSPPES